jgi:hypothetical protein
MKPLTDRQVDSRFWKMIIINCTHEFEWSLQCGEIACGKCYVTYDEYKRKYENV